MKKPPHLLLEAQAVSKRFGRRLLFQDLSFTLRGGETLAVTGPNGSGKSTLLMILAGLLAPSRGRVMLEVDERILSRADHPLSAGVVAPYANLYDPLTARENLEFVAKLRGGRDYASTVEMMLEEVELRERADETVATFSSGMKQRLRLAAALLPEPALLLLDEPSITLDAAGVALVRRIISRVSEAGRIVILATNVAEEAERCHTALHVGPPA